MVVREAPPSVQQLAGTADLYYGGFSKHAREAMRNQRRMLRAGWTGREDDSREIQREVEENLRQADRYATLVNERAGENDPRCPRPLELACRRDSPDTKVGYPRAIDVLGYRVRRELGVGNALRFPGGRTADHSTAPRRRGHWRR